MTSHTKTIICEVPLGLHFSGGDWMPPEYTRDMSITIEPATFILLNSETHVEPRSLGDICDEEGNSTCYKQPIEVTSMEMKTQVGELSSIQPYIDAFLKDLKDTNFQAHKERLVSFENEIKNISELINVTEGINPANINVKKDHFSFKRTKKTHLTTSVFLDVFQYCLDPRYKEFIHGDFKELCEKFGVKCRMPSERKTVIPPKIDSFTLPNFDSILKHDLHLSVCMHHILGLRANLIGYRNRLELSKKVITEKPEYMAPMFGWNDVEEVYIHPSTALYQTYYNNLPARESFDEVYFIHQPHTSNGLVKDATTKKFFLSKGLILAKSKNHHGDKMWNIFFIPDFSKVGVKEEVFKGSQRLENAKNKLCKKD